MRLLNGLEHPIRKGLSLSLQRHPLCRPLLLNLELVTSLLLSPLLVSVLGVAEWIEFLLGICLLLLYFSLVRVLTAVIVNPIDV